MAPTIASESLMPNGRTLLKPVGSPGGAPRLTSTPFDHFPSEIDPSGLTIPPVTTPSLLRAMVSGVMKGSVVTPYRTLLLCVRTNYPVESGQAILLVAGSASETTGHRPGNETRG